MREALKVDDVVRRGVRSNDVPFLGVGDHVNSDVCRAGKPLIG